MYLDHRVGAHRYTWSADDKVLFHQQEDDGNRIAVAVTSEDDLEESIKVHLKEMQYE